MENSKCYSSLELYDYSSNHHCDWEGVSCDYEKRVIEIMMASHNLSGIVPTSIGNLLNLKYLDLSNNQIRQLPLSISLLTNLRFLNISFNSYLKVLPENIFLNMSQLKELDLSFCSNLQSLPPQMSYQVPNLSFLDITGTKISYFPQEDFLSHLPNLEYLYLSFPLDHFIPMNNLIELYLIDGSKFGEDSLKNLSLSTTINTLVIHEGNFSDISILCKTKSLKVISLNFSPIEIIPECFNELVNLKSFGCGNCPITYVPLLNLSSLEGLVIGSGSEPIYLNSLSINRPKSTLPIIDISYLSSIQFIEITAQKILPTSLDKMSSLTDLNVYFLTTPPPLYSHLLNFVCIFCNFTEWTNLSIENEMNEFSLESISLVNHETSIEWPNFLDSLSKLREIMMIGDHLTTPISPEFSSIPYLKSLWIQNSQTTGTIPSELSYSTNLQILVFNNNTFSPNLDSSLSSLSPEYCILKDNQPDFFCESIFVSRRICDMECITIDSLEGFWVLQKISNQTQIVSEMGTIVESSLELRLNSSFTQYVRYSIEPNEEYMIRREGSFEITVINELKEGNGGEYEVEFEFDSPPPYVYVPSSTDLNHVPFYCIFSLFPDVWTVQSKCTSNSLSEELYNCQKSYNRGVINRDPKNMTIIIEGMLFEGESCIPLNKRTPFFGERSEEFQENKKRPQNTEERLSTKYRGGYSCRRDEKGMIECLSICGDSLMVTGEQCEDGNNLKNDGCSSECTIETGWKCKNLTVDSCEPVCGDHLIVSTLDCDIETKRSNSTFDSKIIIIVVFLALLVLGIFSYVVYLSKKEDMLIPEQDLQTIDLLGEGQFGKVFKGLWRNNTEVAIKELKKETVTTEELYQFKEEAKVLTLMRPHPNIVQFLGICLATHEKEFKGPVNSSLSIILNTSHTSSTSSLHKNIEKNSQMMKIVTEYLPGGNLQSFMSQKFPAFSSECWPSSLDYQTLIELAYGIAAGMDHLHQNKIIHRDLAARNVLIQSILIGDTNINSSISSNTPIKSFKLVPKISDFGLSSQLKGNVKIPVRWSPPEVLRNPKQSSYKSDVWSFGVVMYEISLSCKYPPFDGMTNQEVIQTVLRGSHLTPPTFLPFNYTSLMKGCFASLPWMRPNFSQISSMLEEEKELMSNPSEQVFTGDASYSSIILEESVIYGEL